MSLLNNSKAVSFKVYFDVDDGNSRSEIRRFSIDYPEKFTSYSCLTEKLKAVYPSLRNASNIHIYWIGNEH